MQFKIKTVKKIFWKSVYGMEEIYKNYLIQFIKSFKIKKENTKKYWCNKKVTTCLYSKQVQEHVRNYFTSCFDRGKKNTIIFIKYFTNLQMIETIHLFRIKLFIYVQ